MTGIIDAHAHIWRRGTGDYGWVTPEMGAIDRDFALTDVSSERAALGIDRVVLVQAADTAGDTDRMLAEAANRDEVAGVVAWLPLDSPALADDLQRRIDVGAVVGVRALIHIMDDPEWVLRADVADGLDLVSESGLAFDVVTSSPEGLALVPRLAARHPRLHLVVDHLGKPYVGGTSSQHDRFVELLEACAAAPTVAAKLSGLGSNAVSPADWTVDELRPVVAAAIRAFGAERLMYGSDWPMSLLAGGYARAFQGLHAALDATDAELEHIHHATATRWYRLEGGA